MKSSERVDLSVIVTAHSEGIILHKTLKSIERAGKLLSKQGFTYEILVHIDSPTPDTTAYLKANKPYLDQFVLYTNTFKDAGISRNFCVKKAKGTFATFIDGDDLVSEQWLVKALSHLTRNSTEDIIAHSELTVEFGDTSSIVKKHGEIDQATDTLLSVFANRWNAILMTKREILLQNPYEPTQPGYGFEDWHLNNQFIYKGYHNILIPETVIFVRRKATGSRWAEHQNSMAILRANPLLSFENIRKIGLPQQVGTDAAAASAPKPLIEKSKRILNRYPRVYQKARSYYFRLTNGVTITETKPQKHVPKWLLNEWKDIHSIEKELFPSNERLAQTTTYDSLTPAHWQTGHAYQNLINELRHNSYDYIIFVPWVIKGGADKFAISYANTIQAANPKKRVLVLATLPEESPWRDKLNTDFLPFGQLTAQLDTNLQMRVLEQFIENSSAQYFHIINSALGYEFIKSHRTYITGSDKHVIVTSFSQSTDSTGRVFGYSHTHVPGVYNLCEAITTDNQAVISMWQTEYGFDGKKLFLHKPAIEEQPIPKKPVKNASKSILWAARIAPEKLPKLVADIGRKLPLDVKIDMYGSIDDGMDTEFLKKLPPNVSYKGSFNGFFSLPFKDYGIFLYTSKFDGLPNVLLEAGVAGLPIIASAIGGIPELIKNEKTGILVNGERAIDYAAAIQRLTNDTPLATKLSTNLREELHANYSTAAQTKQIVAMLQKLGYI